MLHVMMVAIKCAILLVRYFVAKNHTIVQFVEVVVLGNVALTIALVLAVIVVVAHIFTALTFL